MMDVLTPSQRSRCMSQIRGRNTKPEVRLRHALWSRGLRYRLNHTVTGRPDIVLKKHRLAIFVDGCFWHSCPDHGVRPRTNADFWKQKLKKNTMRDKKVNTLLLAENWRVLRFWEHEVENDLKGVVARVEKALRQKQGKTQLTRRP
jgi:DNA mismatch endonuclease, patch repair protein